MWHVTIHIGAKDQNVVEVDYHKLSSKRTKILIHNSHEYANCIQQSKRHDYPF